MNKYILIGIPNCGKSTLGRRTADALQLPFYDTDLMACEQLKISNPVDQFRAAFNGSIITAQIEAIDELTELNSDAIIATGAEVALIPRCAACLRRMGTVIHIRRSPEIVLADMANSSESRFVLQDVASGTKIAMREEAVRMYAQDLAKYERLSSLTIDNNGNEDTGVEKLVALINSIRKDAS